MAGLDCGNLTQMACDLVIQKISAPLQQVHHTC